jgi:hypothetical protein
MTQETNIGQRVSTEDRGSGVIVAVTLGGRVIVRFWNGVMVTYSESEAVRMASRAAGSKADDAAD